MKKYFGFDLLIFNNRIEFAMERCTSISEFNEKIEADIWRNMATLHQWKVLHMDINPQNIMYSPHFQKVVFIDYGFSEVVEQCQGFKTETAFKGTPEFISKEMFRLMALDDQK